MEHGNFRGVSVVGALMLGSIFAFPPGAYAQDAGWYVGAADVPKADLEASIDTSRIATGFASSATTIDKSGTGWALFGGYQFNENLAVEVGYADLGSFSFTSTTAPPGAISGEMEVAAWSLDAVGMLPLGYGFSLLARAGVVRSETKISVTGTGAAVVPQRNLKERDWGHRFGLGATYTFTRAVSVRAEWGRYHVVDGAGGSADVDLWSWGLRYRF